MQLLINNLINNKNSGIHIINAHVHDSDAK